MKIAFMGPSKSIHLQRWLEWLVKHGHEIFLIDNNPQPINGVKEYDLNQSLLKKENRLFRHIKFEFNSYRFCRLEKMLKIDEIRKVFRLKNLLRSIKPDIVHLHTLFYPAYLGVFANFHPLAVTPWNGDIVWKYQWSLTRNFAVRRALFKADLISVDSEQMKNQVLKYGKYSKKVRNIYFGVDANIFNPYANKVDIRKILLIDSNAPIIFSPRSLENIYNIDIIISAIPLVIEKCPNAVFVFSWHSASKKQELKGLIERLGIKENVRLVGKISSRDELASYYAQSNICITIPSKDTIPASLLEAMASGTVPIISDLESPKECIKDGINGYIVPIRDTNATAQAIINAITEDNIKGKISEYNINLVKKIFDWDKNMRDMENAYYRLFSLNN